MQSEPFVVHDAPQINDDNYALTMFEFLHNIALAFEYHYGEQIHRAIVAHRTKVYLDGDPPEPSPDFDDDMPF